MPAVLIQHEPDPSDPNRLIYTIMSSTRDGVQDAITTIMNRVDEESGYAVFANPRRSGDGFTAQGAVVIYGGEAP